MGSRTAANYGRGTLKSDVCRMSGPWETTSEPSGESRGTVSEPDRVIPGPLHAWIGRRRWVLIVCAIIVVGLGLSLGGALLWRSSVRSRERQQFQTNATDVSETAETLLRRDADLVTTLRGVLTMQPNMSATHFDEWFAEL